jgi:hypothetical protein
MTQYCQYCEQYTQWSEKCPTYRAHVQSCKTARLAAGRYYQQVIDTKDARIRELETQLSKVSPTNTETTKPKSSNKAIETDFSVRYDKSNRKHNCVINSDDITVEFTHTGTRLSTSSLMDKVIDLLSNITI